MARRIYPDEFKAEAVRLFRSQRSERSVREIADDLGIAHGTLRSWVRQADIDEGSRDGLTTEERQRLRFLERENRVLKEEREILKKAAAFFAQETDSTRKGRSSS